MSNLRAFYTNQHCVSKHLRAFITQQKHSPGKKTRFGIKVCANKDQF